jgi:hypothetical protein
MAGSFRQETGKIRVKLRFLYIVGCGSEISGGLDIYGVILLVLVISPNQNWIQEVIIASNAIM